MLLKASVVAHPLQFRFDAGTSRGTLRDKPTWFLLLTDAQGNTGVGECSLIPGLSLESAELARNELHRLAFTINQRSIDLPVNATLEAVAAAVYRVLPHHLPALRFAYETALLDLLHGGRKSLFPTPFSKGESPIPINGLVWMNQIPHMYDQALEKAKAGFSTIKIKIGALNWADELALLTRLRQELGPDVTIRVDANGAFSPVQATVVLRQLADLNIHSIEQPIMAGQIAALSQLCAHTPVPIALDEELIGIPIDKQLGLLKRIRPQYLILKPSLMGGLNASRHWIKNAESLGIGWWMTSALESNIGLNAIAQFTATYNPEMPQGLGTGQLYTNNIDSPLVVANGGLHYDTTRDWAPIG